LKAASSADYSATASPGRAPRTRPRHRLGFPPAPFGNGWTAQLRALGDSQVVATAGQRRSPHPGTNPLPHSITHSLDHSLSLRIQRRRSVDERPMNLVTVATRPDAAINHTERSDLVAT
jgi:hypothetical protein